MITSIHIQRCQTLKGFNLDAAFSIGTGLEVAGVVGSVRLVGSIYNVHKKGGPTRECRSPLRCLS